MAACCLLALTLAVGCTSSGGTPTPVAVTPTTGSTAAPSSGSGSATASGTPDGSSSGTSTATTTSADGDDPALDACDQLGIMPCARQVAQIRLPIAGTSIGLTYSSDRAAGRDQDRAPAADPVGLGGWTLSVLDSLDPVSKTEITGTGTLRQVIGVPVESLTAVAAADGSTVTMFDAEGRASSVLDATTGATLLSFNWGESGLASVSDRSGVALTVIRQADGTPVRLDVARGASTLLGTVSGRIAALQYPDGSRARVATNDLGLVTGWSTAAGRYTAYNYDQHGRLTSRIDGSNATTSYTRDATGQTLNVTTISPTGGRVVDSVTANSGTTTWSHVDAGGATTSLAATGNQRVLTAADGTASTLTLAPDPRWGDDAPQTGRLTSGQFTIEASVKSDSTGATPAAITRTMSVNGQTWTFGYDPATKTATRTDPAGAVNTTGYDTTGRVVRSTVAGGIPVAYTYDGTGRLASITLGTGTDARTWSYRYAGHTVAVTDPAGGVQQQVRTAGGAVTKVSGPGTSGLSLTRDSADRITGFAAPSGGQYQLTWGANGQVAAINAPAGQGGPQFTGFDYDGSGNLIKRFTADTTLAITRDPAGRVQSYDAGAGDVAAGYDAAGRLTSITTPDSTVSDTYTGSAVTTEKIVGPVSSTVTRTLDEFGRTATLQVGGGRQIAYTYDSTGRVSKAGNLTLQHDPQTGLVSASQLGSLSTTYDYNQFGELIGQKVTGPDGVVAEIANTRDGLGRLTKVVTTVDGKDSTTSYSYDDAGRLISETTDDAKRSYRYDDAGNLTSITSPDGDETKLSYDGRGALIKRGDTTYTYDGAGQLASTSSPDTTTKYKYDAAGRLQSVSGGDVDIAYTVDGFGRRVGVTRNGKVTGGLAYLDAQRPLAQTDGASKVHQQFVYTGSSLLPDYVSNNGVDYLEVADPTGGLGIAISAKTGEVADRVVRTALGAVVSESTHGFQVLGFGGGIVDSQTSLVHFGARDYNPASGRWTSPDPMSVAGGSANLYEYVGGDPVNRRDPSGLCDYFTVGLTGSIGGGVGVSGSYGVVLTEGGLGLFETGLVGPGLGGGATLDFGCLDQVGDGPVSPNDIGGPSAGATGGFGPGGFGPDFGYNSDGSPSTVGGHLSIGPDVGIGGGAGYTIVGCLIGCDDGTGTSGGANDQDNPNADGIADCPGGTCNGDPSDAGAPPTSPGNLCDGDGCAGDPGDQNSGGPDSPPGTGPRTTGDPHLRTADNLYYDMQAVGEFTWLQSDTDDLTIQVRQEPLKDSRAVALTTAIAMSVAGDRLTIKSPDERGQPLAVKLAGGSVPAAGTVTLPHGATVVRTETAMVITMTDGTKLWVQTNPYGLNLNAALPASRQGKVHGLVGPFTGASTPGLETSAGQSVTKDKIRDHDTLYKVFADSWRISQDDSLFTDDPGKDATEFDDPDFPDQPAPKIPADVKAAATAICQQLDLPVEALPGCIQDVALTGDSGFASGMAAATASTPGAVGAGAGPPPTSVSGDITPGATVTGSIAVGEKKSYGFTVSAGTVAYFAAAPGCTTGAAGSGAKGSLLWSVVNADGSSYTGASQICTDIGRVQFSKAGSYQLLVSSTEGTAGSYSVTWKESRADLIKTLAAGSTATGSIDKPGARDLYTLDVTAGTVAYFAAAPDCTAPTGGQNSILWYVTNADGSSYTGASQICTDIGRVQFTKSGSYSLVVAGSAGTVGSYSVTWQESRPDLIKSLTAGSTATGSIDKPGARDLYTLDVTAGTVAYFAAAPNCATSGTGLLWYVSNADGSSYTGASQICTDIGRVQFSKAGSYRLVVASTEGTMGSYSVTWQESRPDNTQALTIGSPAAGTIDQPGAHDLWTFTVAANSTVKFAADPGCTGTDLQWLITDSAGSSVTGTSQICTDLGEVTLTAGGNYQVEVLASGAKTGGYKFTSAPG